jgi:hypothetical protein
VGAIGNVISIPIRATILYGKSDADPIPATALAEAAVFGFVPATIVRPYGGVMISLMNRLADVHFKKEPSGRLVFIPFTRKGKCYFVDSKADEEKVRAFVNMYRIPNTLISLLMTPMVIVPGLILEDYGRLTPRAHRLTIALAISGFFWLSFVALALMLWVVYKATVPGLTASLSEVAPEITAQLSAIAPQQRGLRRVALVCLLAGLILLGLALVALTGHSK